MTNYPKIGIRPIIDGQELPKVTDSGFAWYDKNNIDDPEIAANLYE